MIRSLKAGNRTCVFFYSPTVSSDGAPWGCFNAGKGRDELGCVEFGVERCAGVDGCCRMGLRVDSLMIVAVQAFTLGIEILIPGYIKGGE